MDWDPLDDAWLAGFMGSRGYADEPDAPLAVLAARALERVA